MECDKGSISCFCIILLPFECFLYIIFILFSLLQLTLDRWGSFSLMNLTVRSDVPTSLSQKCKASLSLQSPLSCNLLQVRNGLFLKDIFGKTINYFLLGICCGPAYPHVPHLTLSIFKPLTQTPLLPCPYMNMNKFSPAMSGILNASGANPR